MDQANGKCGCFCHSVNGLLIATIGLTFLLGALGVIGDRMVSLTWPVLLILAGLKKATSRLCKCCTRM